MVPGAETLQFRDVEGVSAKVAYLLSIGTGTDSRIYKTADGGATWTLQFQNQDPDAFYDCFAFWTPNRGLTQSDAVNGRFPVLRTTNGTTWQDIGDNLPPALDGRVLVRVERHVRRDPGRQERLDRHRRRVSVEGPGHAGTGATPGTRTTHPLRGSPSAGIFRWPSAIPGMG